MKEMTKEKADKTFKEMIMEDKQMIAYTKEFSNFLDTHPRDAMLIKVLSKNIFRGFLEDVEIQRNNPSLYGGDEVEIEKHRHVLLNVAAVIYAMKRRSEEEGV